MHQIGPTLIFILLLTFSSCSNTPINEELEEKVIETEIKEEAIQYEESVPDSGLLDNVNPEEIITDDWSDEGDLELDTEK